MAWLEAFFRSLAIPMNSLSRFNAFGLGMLMAVVAAGSTPSDHQRWSRSVRWDKRIERQRRIACGMVVAIRRSPTNVGFTFEE